MNNKKYKFAKGTSVIIWWTDSLHTQGWIRENMIDYKKVKRHSKHMTSGFITNENRVSYSVAQSLQMYDNPRNLDSIMTIPKSCITEIQQVKPISLINKKNKNNKV